MGRSVLSSMPPKEELREPQLNIRIDPTLKRRLEQFVAEQRTELGYYVSNLIRNDLDNYEEDRKDEARAASIASPLVSRDDVVSRQSRTASVKRRND